MQLSDYIRLAITIAIVGLLAYQIIIGEEVNNVIKENLALIMLFYFAADRLGDISGKAISSYRVRKVINDIKTRNRRDS